MKFIDTDSVNKNALLDVYNNILQPGAYDILKKFNITHIFISALQTANLIQDYQKAPSCNWLIITAFLTWGLLLFIR